MAPFLARTTVQLLLPIACAWVKWQESSILRYGVPLTISLLADARMLGIRRPERVRLRFVDEVPDGMPRWLRAMVRPLGLCSPLTVGMSLRYGIFIRADCRGNRGLVIHELAHTKQYERFGSVWSFLHSYLNECLGPPGYPFGALEQEATQVEEDFRT